MMHITSDCDRMSNHQYTAQSKAQHRISAYLSSDMRCCALCISSFYA